jgi:hypothetical protein
MRTNSGPRGSAGSVLAVCVWLAACAAAGPLVQRWGTAATRATCSLAQPYTAPSAQAAAPGAFPDAR